MFLGQYHHTIDEKGRITFPSRFRDLLIDGAYVTMGFDNNLLVITTNHWDRFCEQISASTITDLEGRDLRRLMFATAAKVEFDSAGRFLIQQPLKEASHLDGNAVVVGAGNYIEIWAPELWDEQMRILNDPVAKAQRFKAFNLSI
jgi:MraZ protein